MFWTWPVVAIGQLFIALNFAELASHYPVAGSVYQWTKYLSGRGYAWFTGWIYLFAGIITVAAVCATLPIALIRLSVVRRRLARSPFPAAHPRWS